MREQTILKALALARMIKKCEANRQGNIKDLQNAPTWFPTEFIVKLENRITTYNAMLVRLERYYQNTLAKLLKL